MNESKIMLPSIPVCNYVGVSRNQYGIYDAIKNPDNMMGYAYLARLIEANTDSIARLQRFSGGLVAHAVYDGIIERAYHNPKNGKAKNFFNRNVYQNKQDSEKIITKAMMGAVAADIATQAAIYGTTKLIHHASAQAANQKAIKRVYTFLRDYVEQEEAPNKRKGRIELAKIRNQFGLSDGRLEKLVHHVDNGKVLPLEETKPLPELKGSDNLGETLAFFIFSMYCQMHGDSDNNLVEVFDNFDTSYPGFENLLLYFDFLGYNGAFGKELLRECINRYEEICRDEEYYLSLSRQITMDFAKLNLLPFYQDSIEKHCKVMEQYDPYRLRREKNQKLAASGIASVVGIATDNPAIALSGASLALSQIELENDNALEALKKAFNNHGVSSDSYDEIVEEAKKISAKASKYV